MGKRGEVAAGRQIRPLHLARRNRFRTEMPHGSVRVAKDTDRKISRQFCNEFFHRHVCGGSSAALKRACTVHEKSKDGLHEIISRTVAARVSISLAVL